MAQGYEMEFIEEGVKVFSPAISNRIQAVKLPLGSLDSMPGIQGGFQPGRLVINIGLVNEDFPDTILTDLDAPIVLQVRYNQEDIERARASGKPLALAFWNGEQWVRFTKEKHKFELRPDSKPDSGGYGVIVISQWGDPPICWGS